MAHRTPKMMNAAVTGTELLSPSTLNSGNKYLMLSSSVSRVNHVNFTHKCSFHTLINLYPKTSIPKIRSTTTSMCISSSYKPEEARVPPAVTLPKPPVTKANFIFFVMSFPFK